jgi:hypothetical protein
MLTNPTYGSAAYSRANIASNMPMVSHWAIDANRASSSWRDSSARVT